MQFLAQFPLLPPISVEYLHSWAFPEYNWLIAIAESEIQTHLIWVHFPEFPPSIAERANICGQPATFSENFKTRQFVYFIRLWCSSFFFIYLEWGMGCSRWLMKVPVNEIGIALSAVSPPKWPYVGPARVYLIKQQQALKCYMPPYYKCRTSKSGWVLGSVYPQFFLVPKGNAA